MAGVPPSGVNSMSRQASYPPHVLRGIGPQINGLIDVPATARPLLFAFARHRPQGKPRHDEADGAKDDPLLRAFSLIVAVSGVVLLILGGWVAALDHFH